MLAEHKRVCLSINGAQSWRLEKGTIEFKNYFKQIPVSFKIYADFECWKLWRLLHKKYQDHVACSFAYKIVCIVDRFTKATVVLEVKMLLMNLLKQFLKSISTAKS